MFRQANLHLKIVLRAKIVGLWNQRHKRNEQIHHMHSCKNEYANHLDLYMFTSQIAQV